jgi:hypothetical protein
VIGLEEHVEGSLRVQNEVHVQFTQRRRSQDPGFLETTRSQVRKGLTRPGGRRREKPLLRITLIGRFSRRTYG